MQKTTNEDEVEEFLNSLECDLRQRKGAQIESISKNFETCEIDVIQASLNLYRKSLLKEKKKFKKKPESIYNDFIIKLDKQIKMATNLYYNFEKGKTKYIGVDRDNSTFKIIDNKEK